MSIRNLILVVNSVKVLYLLQQYITKCDRSLLQNSSSFLLLNATVFLQNATVITNYDNFITKYDSYYKMPRLLQIATVQTAAN